MLLNTKESKKDITNINMISTGRQTATVFVHLRKIFFILFLFRSIPGCSKREKRHLSTTRDQIVKSSPPFRFIFSKTSKGGCVLNGDAVAQNSNQANLVHRTSHAHITCEWDVNDDRAVLEGFRSLTLEGEAGTELVGSLVELLGIERATKTQGDTLTEEDVVGKGGNTTVVDLDLFIRSKKDGK